MTEADGGVWTTWYDWAGRAVREEAADYAVIERDYVGTQLTQERNLDNTPAVLARTSYTYDALGHLVSTRRVGCGCRRRRSVVVHERCT